MPSTWRCECTRRPGRSPDCASFSSPTGSPPWNSWIPRRSTGRRSAGRSGTSRDCIDWRAAVSEREPIEVDLVHQFGGALPCLSAGAGHEDYSAFLAVVPGAVLGKIYDTYGPRLLELNVRSFLQAKGAVNRGIRDTLANQPDRFLAYNNGISATASRVEVVDLPGGAAASPGSTICRSSTAARPRPRSIARFATASHCDNVAVQAKITVIDPDRVEEIVPLISRYANSQNKVSEADLTANDPFHVQIEELSRTVWAPLTETHTARHALVLRARAGPVRRRPGAGRHPRATAQISEEWPTAQKFTKTDLAKYEMCWDQRPHIVSLGAQKNFTHFMASLRERGAVEPDADLFRAPDREGDPLQGDGPHRGPTSTSGATRPTSSTTPSRDCRTRPRNAWTSMPSGSSRPSPRGRGGRRGALRDRVRVIAEMVPGGANVTEWCKREQVLADVKEQPWTVPASLEPLLVARVVRTRPGRRSARTIRCAEDDPIVAEMAAIGADGWLAIANWAKETGNLAVVAAQTRLRHRGSHEARAGPLLQAGRSRQQDRRDSA